jgi:hypothetical protein
MQGKLPLDARRSASPSKDTRRGAVRDDSIGFLAARLTSPFDYLLDFRVLVVDVVFWVLHTTTVILAIFNQVGIPELSVG